ncbi:glycerol uptake operon antiterminator regulatory protein [Paenibacillus montaniterrae]|uniref:Glycerol uptake operon antiterminator regulatory protein n=1 Tax=Paenibacillus montaniterrae TaxID=429341 RepID=A0A919YLF3_9BACL|nr:glycerol-3-phosphate responsive antiterminator [Paenibacillus montaniterrae]GIP16577.1 glycerol uptake operon antiterminator regulatory protein [Paenibacillus montaniterrae]
MQKQHMDELPIIASITKPEQIEAVLKSKVKRVNLMTGDMMTLSSIVSELHKAGKQVHVHLEMVSGLGRDLSAVQYLSKTFGIDGIVSTKSNMIAAARQVGIGSIQRIFAIDTAAVETAIKMIGQVQPDEVELMPGLMPRVIRDLKQKINSPLIVGGLIRHEEEIRQALANGADYVSIGDKRYWL